MSRDIEELFEKIKPLLDYGYLYSKAYSIVTNKPFNRKNMMDNEEYRALVEYGVSQGYPKSYRKSKRRYRKSQNKYGITHVGLIKNPTYATGYIWKYYIPKHLQKGQQSLCGIDLKILRRRVESLGLEWKVVDISKARESYEFNRELQKIFRNKPPRKSENKSGVYYVFKAHNHRTKQGYIWKYQSQKNNVSLSSIDPQKLKEKVLSKGLDWIILDENKAKENGLL